MDDGVGGGQIDTATAGLEADREERHLASLKVRDRAGAIGFLRRTRARLREELIKICGKVVRHGRSDVSTFIALKFCCQGKARGRPSPIAPSIGGMSVYSHQFFDQQSAGSLASAHVVLKALFDIASFESVVDVGCGVAPWLRAAKDFGVNYVVGLDGDYVDRKCLLVEPACFRSCDLEAEDLRRVIGDDGPFDLAICMEVAEHLSAGRAPAFVRELCSLSDFVLFSAAIPGQGGTNHVNEQWPEYWAAMFANNSFVCFDVLRPCLWSREECKWWYIQNVLLFAKRDQRRRK
jgi:hypothetical protein